VRTLRAGSTEVIDLYGAARMVKSALWRSSKRRSLVTLPYFGVHRASPGDDGTRVDT
jgi:hypothetical protein